MRRDGQESGGEGLGVAWRVDDPSAPTASQSWRKELRGRLPAALAPLWSGASRSL